MTTFNSKQYNWCKLSVAFGGRIIDGITEVEYTEKQEKSYLFGRGNTPHSVLRGQRTYEGKISLWQSELEAMTRDAPSKDVMKLNFDIIITYVPDDIGGQIVTDILKGCEFSEVKKAMKQGDKNMIIELPIMITKILRQQ